MAGGVDAVVHACTEVPLALEGVVLDVPASDSTAALARLAMRHAIAAAAAAAGGAAA